MTLYGNKNRPRTFRGFREEDEDEFEEDDVAATDVSEEEDDEEKGDAILGPSEEVNNSADEEISENFEDAGEIEAEEDVQNITDESLDEEGSKLSGNASGDFEVEMAELNEIVEASDAEVEEIQALHDTLYADVPVETVGMFNKQFTSLPDEDGEMEVELLKDDYENDYENTSYNEPLVDDDDNECEEEDEEIDPDKVELV